MPVSSLSASGSVTLDVNGAGQVAIGPQDAVGPSVWNIDTVIVQTTRPGQAPIPMVQIYIDQISPANSQGLNYDGSFNQGQATNVRVTRGSHLIAVWAGGQAGDIATLTVTGTKE